MMHPLSLFIKVVNNHVGVAAVTSSKYDDLEVFAKRLQNLSSIGPYVDACLDHLPIHKLDGQFHITSHVSGIIAMYQSLIQIEHQSLLAWITK